MVPGSERCGNSKGRSFICQLRSIMRTIASALIHVGIVTALALALNNLAVGGEIHNAARRGDLEKVKALLKGDQALALSEDDTGWTPLHLAAQKAYGYGATLLSNEAQSTPRAKKRGYTLALGVASNGHKEVAELLLDNRPTLYARWRQ